ncbi:hypothetical protein BDN72DRAFT_959455 [Pluteus cervinus]|uniref:Uncharacterized protein n=1 Tax=Pluteus cervinus TaxID=181527 RepID=A0ACD3AUR0_9AGAR|nr:hypothetical protein BDN72DRAFT_959455 [Pluteus cervinus]
MADPIFPPEIEQVIFTDALGLKHDGESPLDLLLVARRVHTWLMEVLIKTIAFTLRRGTPARKYPFRWEINTLERYGMHTRHFFYWEGGTHPDRIEPARYFALCPNITNLVLWIGRGLNQADIESFSHLPLTHLSINVYGLPKATPKLIQFYSRITHLENVSGFSSSGGGSDSTTLRYFTSLTHVAIPDEDENLFGCIPTLQVLVVSRVGTTGLEIGGSGTDDPRVVEVTYGPNSQVEEWLLDVQEGRGMWGSADNVVRERLKRKTAL